MAWLKSLWFAVSVIVLACVFVLSSLLGAEAEELTLRMLIWDGYAPNDVQEAFKKYIKKQFDVELIFEITYASNPDSFFDKLRTGEVDLVSPAHNLPKDTRYNLTKNNLTIPVNLENIPNYQSLRPELSRQPWAVDNGEIYAVPIVHGIYGLAYDSSVVSPPPDSWSILWDPRYAGLYSVNKDYYELNIYITALSLGERKEDIFTYDRIKKRRLEQRLGSLAQNAGRFWVGFDQPEDYENLSLATTWRFTFPKGSGFSENWRVAVPREGTPWTIDTMMLSSTLANNSKLHKIAELWINFLLEPENQLSIFAKRIGTYPVTKDAWDIYTKDILSVDQKDRLERLFDTLIPWEILKTRDRNAFHLLWKEAMTDRLINP